MSKEPKKIQPTAPEDRVPFWKRVAYGAGNLSDHIGTGTLIGNANPIFNVTLGMDPRLIGLALGVMRLWDSITDPLMGSISDNARTRFGRRIPFMFIGSVGCALTFPLIWMVPHGFEGMSLFWWFLIFSILFFTFQTIFSVPHSALGYELTPDVHERTRVMEMRAYLGKAATLFVPWAYAITQLPIWNGDTLLGARYMGVAYGTCILMIGIIPALSLKERFFKMSKKQQKLSFLKSVTLTFRNKPFLMMIAITLLTVVGSTMVSQLGFYVGLYYLYNGDTVAMSILHGVYGNLSVVLGLISVFILNRVSHRIGKRHTLAICLVLLIFSSFAKWIFYRPDIPYLSLLVAFFVVPSFAGFWLLISSLKADICDYEELQTGLRREGALASVSSWITKASYSATSIISGFVLVYTGYQAANGAEQPQEVIDKLRFFFYILPSATAVPALILLYYFPISEKRAQEIRVELEARRGKL